jgi:zinc transporter, ZIP family
VIGLGFAETALLGAIAGFTIYLGLPLGRIGRVDDRLRVALAMFSVGILAFVFMDVANHGQEIVSGTLDSFKDGNTSFAHVLGLFMLLAAGFTAGTAGISSIEGAVRRRHASAVAPIAGGSTAAAVSMPELARYPAVASDPRRRALQTGMTIAVAIGLHNFAEGLAIGVSAKAGAIGLATVLIIGFGLHNATEGFGIVGPLGGVRPSWAWLGLVGLVGGGPTFLGTIVGYQVHSDALQLCFYALAGGAILYVVGEIWTAVRRHGHRTLGLYLLAAGFLAGVATDLLVSYGGG